MSREKKVHSNYRVTCPLNLYVSDSKNNKICFCPNLLPLRLTWLQRQLLFFHLRTIYEKANLEPLPQWGVGREASQLLCRTDVPLQKGPDPEIWAQRGKWGESRLGRSVHLNQLFGTLLVCRGPGKSHLAKDNPPIGEPLRRSLTSHLIC